MIVTTNISSFEYLKRDLQGISTILSGIVIPVAD